LSRLIVVVSDVQYPYHNKRAVANVLRLIGQLQPDEVVQIGDLMDYPQPARWSKGTQAEFAAGVMKDSENIQRDILAPLREAYDGPVTVLEGNHDLRPRTYLAKYAPALAESRAFDLDVLLNFDEYDVRLITGFYDFHPGWTFTHGHLGFSLSRYAGGTALNAAKRIGKSLVCGHTHRLGFLGESTGYDGRGQTLWGFEVGHLMNVRGANYLKYGYGNWQSGFGIIEVDGNHVTPRPVLVRPNGSFFFDGMVYE
jgi:predicted phosphodiesterase